VGFNTPQLAAVKLWQRFEFMVVNPTRTKNFLYKKNTPLLCAKLDPQNRTIRGSQAGYIAFADPSK
jgi:hypothetical protein